MTNYFYSGKNVHEKWEKLDAEEIQIVDLFASRDWYLTRIITITLARSQYNVVLMKPSPLITNAFNLHREIVVAFSPYQKFEPRSIDAIEYLDIQELRLEEICSIIISRDVDIESKVNSILKNNEEARVIIPFSYEELLNNLNNPEFVINKFRKNFYSRDLFGIQDPLKRDLYFFGRRDLIHTLANRHLNSENSGVFGLRKTGKTSIIYSLERALDRKNVISIFIDCLTLHLKSWNTALYSIIADLQVKSGVKKNELKLLANYQNLEFVSDYFYDDIKTIYKKNKKSIFLIFDEIENITFDTSESEGWRNGSNFTKFWQILRGTYQKFRTENVFTYLITGTNPRCIEKPSINRVDNPIFAQFPPIYIPAFDVIQTKEMVDKLGGYMGLHFEDVVCGRLVEDYGGHPMLMRQVCSYIHNRVSEQRPFTINKTSYELFNERFLRDENGFDKYALMVLEVLTNWYDDEFYMLTLLSIGDYSTFQGLAENSPEYITHLLNYGIIEKAGNDFGFKIEALKTFLSKKNKYKKLNLSNDEKQKEISERRNKLEPKLRKIIKNQLRLRFNEDEAKKKVISEIYGAKEINKYISTNYADLFDPNKHNIFLKNCFELMRKNWEDCFRNMFDVNVDIFEAKTTLINHYRKPDAHAAQISDSDMNSFRGSMDWIEQKVEDY